MNKLTRIFKNTHRHNTKIYDFEKKYGIITGIIKRRKYYNIDKIPFKNIQQNFYKNIYKKNCENVVGYIPIPVGIIENICIDGIIYNVPFATTEGTLIASINRGAKVIKDSNKNGIKVIIKDKGITRAPLLEVKDIFEIEIIKDWIENNLDKLNTIFKQTTNYGNLTNVSFGQSGNKLFIRFSATTGNAMGMNMITKGISKVMFYITKKFKNTQLLSLSSNYCTDKKVSYLNYINGRCKYVVASALINKELIYNKLHTSPEKLIKLNYYKNHIGSNLAGTIGGNNCHTANIIAGIFTATGQDLGQIGTSSLANIDIEDYDNSNIIMYITMPSLEIGTIGGGTNIMYQSECLKFMDVKNDSKKMAEIIIGTVLAGELSLLSALTNNNELVNSHMNYNR